MNDFSHDLRGVSERCNRYFIMVKASGCVSSMLSQIMGIQIEKDCWVKLFVI